MSGTTLYTGSIYPITASRAITASYALNATGGGSSLYTGSSYPITASWALYVVNGTSGTASLSLTNITRSGNGSGSVFNLNNNTFTGTNSLVFLGGITLNNNIDYTLSSGILTFTTPPLLNEEIHAVKFSGGGANGSNGTSGIVGIANAQTFTSNGVASQYALTQSVVRSYDIIVAINGVVQNYSSSYTVTGSTLTLASAPPLNSKIDVRFLGNAAGGGGGGSSLHTGSKYPITSSWATRVLTASYALNFGNSVTQSFNNLATWTFNHNLGERTVVIQAYNTSYNQIIPQSIILDTVNSARLTFPVSASGYAIATRGGVRIFSSSYGYYNLNTGSTYPITSSWSRRSLTASVALNLLNSDSVSSSFTNSPTWTFNHNLGSKPVLIQTYNNSFNQVLPQTIVLSNLNTATITFPVSSSGYAIATRSGLRTIPAASNLATTGSNNFKNSQTISNGYLILSYVSASLNFANDTAAGTGGVPRGGVYRNGNILQIRII